MAEVVRRHEALRTVFAVVESAPVQVIRSAGMFELPFTDLSELSAAEKDLRLEQLRLLEAETPFDLQGGPLLRVRLVRTGDAEHFLFVTMHHIISDGPSLEVLLHEMVRNYEDLAANRPFTLPELRYQYADYAAWQRQWIAGELLENELAYSRGAAGRLGGSAGVAGRSCKDSAGRDSFRRASVCARPDRPEN